MYKLVFKRILDIALASIAAVMLFPVFIIVYVILMFVNNGKPLFLQPRPGKNERVFKILKFKTMTDKTDDNGNLLPNELRMTRFGSFLRRSSLDEIPQLINVLKGDMSLVGPRPLRVRYLPYYTKEESIRHTVKPGVTGLAQVSGRNSLSWDDKLAIDIKYVKSLSLVADVSILIKTVIKVFANNSSDIELGSTTLNFDEYRIKYSKND